MVVMDLDVRILPPAPTPAGFVTTPLLVAKIPMSVLATPVLISVIVSAVVIIV